MSANPIIDTIEGTVTRTNDKGFVLAGREPWVNISQYAKPLPAVPPIGSIVRVGLDKAGFARSVEIIGGNAQPPSANGAPASTTRDRVVSRLALLNTATAILSSGGRPIEVPKDVVALAQRLEGWVYRDIDEPDE